MSFWDLLWLQMSTFVYIGFWIPFRVLLFSIFTRKEFQHYDRTLGRFGSFGFQGSTPNAPKTQARFRIGLIFDHF